MKYRIVAEISNHELIIVVSGSANARTYTMASDPTFFKDEMMANSYPKS